MALDRKQQLERELSLRRELKQRQSPPAVVGQDIAPMPLAPISDPADVGAPPRQTPDQQLYDTVRQQLNRGPSDIGSMIGGTIGGTAGGAAAGALAAAKIGQIPPLTWLPEELITVPAGAAIGAYMGGAGGSAIEQRLFTPSGVVDWKDVHKAGLWEAGTEVAGRGLIGGVKAVGSLLPIPSFRQPSSGPSKTILPEPKPAGKHAQQVFQDSIRQLERRGGVATPSQVDKRWWLHVGEGFARGSWVGSEAFEDVVAKNESILVEMLKDTVDDMVDGVVRRTPTETGEDLFAAIGRQLPTGGQGSKIRQWHALFDPIYAQVDDLAKGPVASTSKLKSYADTMLKRDQMAKGRLLESSTRQDLLAIKKMDDNLTLQTMRDLRTKWQGKVRQFGKDMNPDMARVNDLSKLADDSIMNAATSPNLSPDARSLLQSANKHYARYKKTMEEVFPMRLAEKLRTNPERVATDLFPAPKRQAGGSLRRIEAVRDALTLTPTGRPDPEGTALFNEIRQAWMAGIVAQNTEKGAINTNGVRAQLRRYGKDSLDILLPAHERKAIEAVLNAADATRLKGLMSGGALVAKSAQAAGAGYLLYDAGRTGNFVKAVGGGTALVFGPIAWARLATHPVGSRILRSGIPQFAGHRQLATTSARLIRILMAEDKKEQKQAAALQRRYEREMRPKPQLRTTVPDRPVSGHHF